MTLNFVSVKMIYSDQSFIVTVSHSAVVSLENSCRIYCLLILLLFLSVLGKQRRSGKRFSLTIYLPYLISLYYY